MVEIRQVKKIFKESQSGLMDTLKQILSVNPRFQWYELLYGGTGDTILHVAARKGHVELLEYLLTFTPSAVDVTNVEQKTALHEAAQFCQLMCAQVLVEEGADVNALKRGDWTPLMLACTKIQANSISLLNFLLDRGAIIDYKNKDGWTASHITCRDGNVEILKLLINHGANLKVRTNNNRTTLHIAALHGKLDIMKELISRKVLDVNIQDNCGHTPLHEAVLGNHIDMCRLLIRNGADIKSKTQSGFSVLHLAASHSKMETLEFVLKELNFKINDVTESGFTALHCAARKNRKDVYSHLLKNGIDSNLKDKYGRTACTFLNL